MNVMRQARPWPDECGVGVQKTASNKKTPRAAATEEGEGKRKKTKAAAVPRSEAVAAAVDAKRDANGRVIKEGKAGKAKGAEAKGKGGKGKAVKGAEVKVAGKVAASAEGAADDGKANRKQRRAAERLATASAKPTKAAKAAKA